jgi:hypothetical protein
MHLQGSNRSNSSMGFEATSTTIHHPVQGAGFGGATSSLYLALYAIMFIKLCSSFMSIFAFLNPHVVSGFPLSNL